SLDSAQLFRTQPDGSMKILSVDLREALAGNPVDNVVIQPRDRLLVHKNPTRVDPPTVYIKGEVAKPGRYPLTTNMRVEDLVRVAGGLKKTADTDTADLTSNPKTKSRKPVPKKRDANLSEAMKGNSSRNLPLNDANVPT